MSIADLFFARRRAKSLTVYGAGDDLVICCSAANRREGSFDFYKALAGLRTRRVYINTPRNCFYHLGAYGLGDSPGSVAAALRSKIAREKPARVHVVGASMGGFGALLFGSLLRADTAIAFNAGYEMPIAVLGQLAIDDGVVRPEYMTLLPLIRRAKRTKFYLLNSDHFGRDLHQAIGLASEPNVRVLLHPCTHNLLELIQLIPLQDAVELVMSGRTDEMLRRVSGRVMQRVDAGRAATMRAALESAFNAGNPAPDWVLRQIGTEKRVVTNGTLSEADID